MPQTIVILHNIRSAHNVGSIFRTAEGFGVSRIIVSGYTPYPLQDQDSRLPHIGRKLTAQIHKTALGAENLVPFEHQENLDLEGLSTQGFNIVGLEQDDNSVPIADYQPSPKIALLLGEEVAGISPDLRRQCHDLLEIPMQGQKQSFNVAVAAGIALYALDR